MILILWCSPLLAGEMFAFLGQQATEAQARSYADLIKGDPSQLGHSSAGTAGQTNFDNQTFVYTLTCTAGSITLYALSDDGVSIEIVDQTAGTQWNGLSRLGTGQAMPNLAESFQKCTGSLEAGHEYQVTVRYRNTLYTGAGDIDGVKLIAIGGTAAFGEIKLDDYTFGSWENDGGGDSFFGFVKATCAAGAVSGYQLDFNLDGNFDATLTPGPTGHAFVFDQPLLPFLGPYDDGSSSLDLRVSTTTGLSKKFRLSYPVGNFPPVLSASTTADDASRTVTLSVSAADLGPDPIGSIAIDWGDGEQLSINGAAGVVSHTYAVNKFYEIIAHASDGQNTNSVFKYAFVGENGGGIAAAGVPTASGNNRYRKPFLDANPLLKQSIQDLERFDIDVHHMKPQQFTRYYELKGVVMDDLSNLVAIPRKVHNEMSGLQNSLISEFIKENGDVSVDNIDLLDVRLSELYDQYKSKWFIENGAGEERIMSVYGDAKYDFNKFALGKAERKKPLGLLTGNIALFGLLASKAEAASLIVSADPSTDAALDRFLATYDGCLVLAEQGEIPSNYAHLLLEHFCAYARAINTDADAVNAVEETLGALIDTNNVPGVRP